MNGMAFYEIKGCEGHTLCGIGMIWDHICSLLDKQMLSEACLTHVVDSKGNKWSNLLLPPDNNLKLI